MTTRSLALLLLSFGLGAVSFACAADDARDELLPHELEGETEDLLKRCGRGKNLPCADAGTPTEDAGVDSGSSTTTCTSFTYSAWGTCQADGTQTRTVTSSSPSGCTGGTPILTQACTPPPAPTGATCTNPVFVTSDPNGGWSTEGYYVHNNMWNSSATLGPETLSACSYRSWYVVSNQTNEAGAVKTYPNVHKDYADVPISSFSSIKSTFAATSPHVGIYNVAYDIWLNGVASNGSTELMIWTENFNQVPAGSKAASVTLGGHTYDVWKTSDSHYIALVPTTVMVSGTIDLLEMFKWLMSKGWLASNATVGQIDFGVEIVSTNGAPARWDFTDFSITSN